jgi:hypothetical protein
MHTQIILCLGIKYVWVDHHEDAMTTTMIILDMYPQTKTFPITQAPPQNTGKISGYVFEDTNNNGVKDV